MQTKISMAIDGAQNNDVQECTPSIGLYYYNVVSFSLHILYSWIHEVLII